MKKLLYLSMGLLIFSCSTEIQGEGESNMAQDFKTTSFSDIDAEGKFKLRLIPNDSAYVSVQSHQNLIDNIIIKSTHDKLSISENTAVSSFEDYSVYVYYNSPLQSIELDNSIYLESSDAVITDRLSLDLNDNSKVKQFTVACKELDIDAKDMVSIELSGSTNELELDLEGNATADLSKLSAKVADVDMINETEATLNVANEIKGSVKNNAILNYMGTPQKDVDVVDLGSMNNK